MKKLNQKFSLVLTFLFLFSLIPNFNRLVKAEEAKMPAADMMAVLTGNFVKDQGLGNDWDTKNQGTLMKEYSKGIYELTVDFKIAKEYEYKVAFDGQWDNPKALGDIVEKDKNKKLNVVVDIGANSGDFSIFLNKSAKKIFAFEPITEVYDKMNKNILVNNLDNIKTFNLGVSEKCQKLKLTIPESTGSSKVSIFGDYEIKTISWDKLYELIEKPQKIDLLKMDCEGCEYSLINNSSILDYVQEIRMEIHIFEEKDKYKAINRLKLLCMKKFLLIKTTEFNINKQGNWEMHFMKI
jgi:FkbM family methyltransferase